MNNNKSDVQCRKCGYQWHTTSKLKKVTCPSCNQKTPNTALRRRHPVNQFIQQKRGIIGLEAAIVLIAFVIIAAAFSFMVVNQGLFATERGKTVIQEGLKQASTPLTVDGTLFMRTNPEGKTVNVIIIPVKAFGVKYVAMGKEQTVMTLKIGQRAWANVYLGVLYIGQPNINASQIVTHYNATGNTCEPSGYEFDDFVGFQLANQTMTGEPCNIYVNETYNNGYNMTYTNGKGLTTGVVLAIANSNGDEALDTGEKGFLIVTLAEDDAAFARDEINIEIRLEKSATLSLEFSIPESMPQGTYVPAL